MSQSLQAALTAAGLVQSDQTDSKQRNKNRPQRKYGKSRDVRSFEWEHPLFGSLHVGTNFNLEKVRQVGPNTWAKLNLPSNEPKCIRFSVTGQLAEGVHFLVFNENDMTDMETADSYPSFHVPIRYEGAERKMATHMKKGIDRDNVLLRKSGTFVNFEISAVTRKDSIWICGQENYGGQIVVVDLEDAQATPGLTYHEYKGKAIMVVPLYAENAFPDHENPDLFRSYLKILPSARQVAEYAYDNGCYASFDDCEIAEWDPQWPELTEAQAKAGWKKGVTTFFNLALGWGFVRCEDGKHSFVHFSDIIDDGGAPVWTKDEFPVIQPMEGVLIRYVDQEDGRRKARSIRVPK